MHLSLRSSVLKMMFVRGQDGLGPACSGIIGQAVLGEGCITQFLQTNFISVFCLFCWQVQGGGNVGNALTAAARLGIKCRIFTKVTFLYSSSLQTKDLHSSIL